MLVLDELLFISFSGRKTGERLKKIDVTQLADEAMT